MDKFDQWLIDHNVDLPESKKTQFRSYGMTARDLRDLLNKIPEEELSMRVVHSDSQWGPQEVTGIAITDFEGCTVDDPEEYDRLAASDSLKLKLY